MPKRETNDLVPTLKWIIQKLEEHERMLKAISAVLRDSAQDEQIGAIQIILSSVEGQENPSSPQPT